MFVKVEKDCSKIHKNLSKIIKISLEEIKKNWPKKLPSGIIHADLFPDNIFFKNEKFTGIIDFYFSCNDFYCFEIAVCLNALCFDGVKENLSFNVTKAKKFIKGYTSIRKLNKDEKIDGFIVQLPVPKHINENNIILAIDPKKDVDGFCPENVGNLTLGLPTYISATPNGIMELLRRHNIETEGKHCVVLGRSNIVGTPIAVLLSRNSNPGNATVTIAHSKTKDLKGLCLSAIFLSLLLVKQSSLLLIW